MHNTILVDTHCHLNLMVKKNFDHIMTVQELEEAQKIIDQAQEQQVNILINVGTSIIESTNCVALSKQYESVYATVGIHPNDAIEKTIKSELKELAQFVHNKKENKIVGIGECGMDRHYPEYNHALQEYAFKQQIELALQHSLALVVHSRDAADETLKILGEYRQELNRVVMHCYSYDQSIAHDIIGMGFMLGIGGTVTYPKNVELRNLVTTMPIEHIVLETDAPYLPMQTMRGKENHPQYIRAIAEFIAQLRATSWEEIASKTTENAMRLFGMK